MPKKNAGTLVAAHSLAFDLPDGRTLLEAVDFRVESGRKIGLIGPNGAGKSTLLKLILGQLTPRSGTVDYSKSVAGKIHAIAQDTLDRDEESLASVLGLDRHFEALREGELERAEAWGWDFEDRCRKALESAGLSSIHLDRPVSGLSGGERSRLRIARVLVMEPELLLLDEPTNHLDRGSRDWIGRWLGTWGGAAVIATHDRKLLEAMDEVWELDVIHGRASRFKNYGCGYAEYLELKSIERTAAERRVTEGESDLRKQKRDLQQAMERQTKRTHRGEKHGAKAGLPKIIRGALKRKAEVTTGKLKDTHGARLDQATQRLEEARAQIPVSNEIRFDLPEAKAASGKILVEIRGLNFILPGEESPIWIQPLDRWISGNTRVALNGANGSGKTTLLRSLLDPASLESSGFTTIGEASLKTERWAYLDQHCEILDLDRSLLENFAAFTPHLTESERRIRLGRFLFPQERVHSLGRQMSCGERMRAALACTLHRECPPQLLILDEPTNHLDLPSIEALESALQSYPGAILVVSHDEKFLEALGVDETWRLERRNRVGWDP